MRLEDLKALPISDIAAPDCALFMWVTYPMLREGLEVIDAWGFEYKTIAFQWVKTNMTGNGWFFGIGHWTRSNTECCLLATRGRPRPVSKRISQLIVAPRGRHSAKPTEVRARIEELMGDLPRIQLFSRERVDGWDALGNDLDGRDIRDSLRDLLAGDEG